MSRLPSLTVVSVVADTLADPVAFERFATMLEGQVVDFDFVLVCNAVGTGLALRLKELVAGMPDMTAVFLGSRVHDDVARLVGIDHAVGDFVLFCNPATDDPAAIPALLEPLRAGFDLVVAEMPDASPRRAVSRRVSARAYMRLYGAMTGMTLDRRPTGLRVLSRAAALFLASQPNSELLVRARALGQGFPATSVAVCAAGAPATADAGASHSLARSIGMLLNASTLPLRGASYTALLGGVLSVAYSLYVSVVYVFKPDVATGWTTLSLQLAGMMFIFSLVLFFLSEYVIQIHSASPPRSRRYLVLRELRSPSTRRSLRLNVVDGEGRFQVGQPAWLRRPAGEV